MVELVEKFAISPHRCRMLDGLLRYRAELRRVGLCDGFQWIDGSFVETLPRDPNDVDVVTLSSLPTASDPADDYLFDPREAKRHFSCDAYFIDLKTSPLQAINDAVYWYGLFSHQRGSERWKGLVQVDLAPADGDAAARERLREILEEGAS